MVLIDPVTLQPAALDVTWVGNTLWLIVCGRPVVEVAERSTVCGRYPAGFR
jgi:hypothetical protein